MSLTMESKKLQIIDMVNTTTTIPTNYRQYANRPPFSPRNHYSINYRSNNFKNNYRQHTNNTSNNYRQILKSRNNIQPNNNQNISNHNNYRSTTKYKNQDNSYRRCGLVRLCAGKVFEKGSIRSYFAEQLHQGIDPALFMEDLIAEH